MGRTDLWTLVQHSGFSHLGKPQFEKAVEQKSITEAQAERIRKLGGLVFDSYAAARNAEYAENYPQDVKGLVPQVTGNFGRQKFGGMKLGGQKLYYPKRPAPPDANCVMAADGSCISTQDCMHGPGVSGDA